MNCCIVNHKIEVALAYIIFLQCTGRWPCINPRLNKLCKDNGVTYDSRCHMRRDECIYEIDITVTKGACTGELNIMYVCMYAFVYNVCIHGCICM